jgi:5-methylcytosine-specific restriction endonuclease McrA
VTERKHRGYRWRQIAAEFRVQCAKVQAPCWLCGQPIDYNAQAQTAPAFEADHRHPVNTHPHLAFMRSNLRPSHSSCNRSRGSKPIPTGDWVSADF